MPARGFADHTGCTTRIDSSHRFHETLMHHAQHTFQVRQFITEAFVDLGARPESPVRETILIRNAQYCGRRFDRDGFQAIWFVEEGEVKFYGPDGLLLRVSSPSAGLTLATHEQPQAA